MKNIRISEKICNLCPSLVVAAISCNIKNTEYDEGLWKEIDALILRYKDLYKLEDINKRFAISATRAAYKKTGKDPNRYRPSAEALCRRICRDMDLYKINTVVDVINYISIETGYSIGGFDENKIQGDDLLLDIGTNDDVFEGIGRGILNIEGLPVYRDSIGGIGTPTSDNERTKLDMNTCRLLMIINAYSGEEKLEEGVNMSIKLLEKYLSATDISTVFVKTKNL